MTIGDSSPAVAATSASSTSRRPSVDPPLPEQGAALLVAGEPDQVRVAEPLADRGRLGRVA